MLMAVLFFVRPRMRLELKAILIIAAALLCNRLYSTQFNLWFYPFVFLLLAESKKSIGPLLIVLLALDFVNVVVFPFGFAYTLHELDYNSFANGSGSEGGAWTMVFSAAVIIRALLLLGLMTIIWAWEEKADPP